MKSSRKRKTKKRDKFRWYEYVIFITGGIIALSAGIYGAFYSVGQGNPGKNIYHVQLQTNQFVCKAILYDSEPSKIFKSRLPVTLQARVDDIGLVIPVDPSLPVSSFESKPPEPGEIIYRVRTSEIIIITSNSSISDDVVILGRLLCNPTILKPVSKVFNMQFILKE